MDRRGAFAGQWDWHHVGKYRRYVISENRTLAFSFHRGLLLVVVSFARRAPAPNASKIVRGPNQPALPGDWGDPVVVGARGDFASCSSFFFLLFSFCFCSANAFHGHDMPGVCRLREDSGWVVNLMLRAYPTAGIRYTLSIRAPSGEDLNKRRGHVDHHEGPGRSSSLGRLEKPKSETQIHTRVLHRRSSTMLYTSAASDSPRP